MFSISGDVYPYFQNGFYLKSDTLLTASSLPLCFSDAANFGLNIEFASGFVIESGACGGHHCCMISADHLVQCFGANGNGQLGYGDTNIRGDEPDEMGDVCVCHAVCLWLSIQNCHFDFLFIS